MAQAAASPSPAKNDEKKKAHYPVDFKLKLIEEVNKFERIWKNSVPQKKQDKLRDFEDWNTIVKKVAEKRDLTKWGNYVPEGEKLADYTKNCWARIVTNYTNHVKGTGIVAEELVKPMVFMEDVVKKYVAAVNAEIPTTSEPEEMAPTPNVTPKPKKTPKSGKKQPQQQQQTPKNKSAGEQQSERDIADVLYDSLKTSPMDMTKVRAALLDIFLDSKADIKQKIIDHGNKQLEETQNYKSPIDWSALTENGDVSEDLCNAVWDFKVNEMLLENLKK